MSGQLTATLESLDAQPAAASAPTHQKTATPGAPGDEPMIVVPAGLFGDVIGSLAGVAGKVIGRSLGNEALGQSLGNAAGPLIKHFSPFTTDPTQESDQGSATDGAGEALVVVPAGFLSGLLGGVGGELLGKAVGGLLGNKQLGGAIGGALGGAAGTALGPFSMLPPEVAPADAGPDRTGGPDEPMILVPAGFLGNLLGGISGTVGELIGGDQGRQWGTLAGGVLQKVVPWQALPPELAPASAGPDQGTPEDSVVVPAGWLSSVTSLYGDTICRIGGNIPSPALTIPPDVRKSITAFSTVPPSVAPMSVDGNGHAEEELVYVPAGLFGGLLSSLGGVLGSAVGKQFGAEQLGGTLGGTLGRLGGKLFPFQVVPPSA